MNLSDLIALYALIGGSVIALIGKKIESRHGNLKKYIPLNDLKPIPIGMPIIARGSVHIEHPLISPISQKESIYYKYSLEQQVSSDSSDPQAKIWQQVSFPSEEKIPFTLKDEVGEAYIEAANGSIESGTVTERIFRTTNELNDKQRSFLDTVISAALNPVNENTLYRAREIAVYVDQKINVFGVARVEGETIYIGGSKDYPLIISNKSREALIETDTQFAKLLIIVGVIAICVSLATLLLNNI